MSDGAFLRRCLIHCTRSVCIAYDNCGPYDRVYGVGAGLIIRLGS